MNRCAICDQRAIRRLIISHSRTGPDGTREVSGKVYVCSQDYSLVMDLSIDELEFLLRSDVRPVPPPPVSPPVTERDETAREAIAPFESHRNGNSAA